MLAVKLVFLVNTYNCQIEVDKAVHQWGNTADTLDN